MATTSMIVMEPGSDWPEIEDSTTLVALSPPQSELLRRTQDKLRALERVRQNVELAVLACNAATGGQAEERSALARALLAAVSRSPHGRLILAAGGHASFELRSELVGLAGRLTQEARDTTAIVSLWFRDASELR